MKNLSHSNLRNILILFEYSNLFFTFMSKLTKHIMSEELKVSGRLSVIQDIQSGESKNGKSWQKRDFVIETEGQYPKLIAFTLFGDKVVYVDKFSIGTMVEVKFNLESRSFGDKYFTNVNAYSVTGETQQNTTGGGVNYQSAVTTNGLPPSEMPFSNPKDGTEPEEEDGLPF